MRYAIFLLRTVKPRTYKSTSNTNSNVMFGALQVGTAKALGISTVIMAAAQSVGGSVGCCIAPSKVLIGSATVGLDGREGEILNRTIPLLSHYHVAGRA